MAETAPQRYRHAEPAFGIDLPEGAELGHVPGMLLAARRPAEASASPFRSNLTVVAEPLPEGLGFAAYCEGSLAVQGSMFPHWRLVDRETVVVSERPALRTHATYRVARDSGVDFGRTLSVTVEQWRLLADGAAWTASASCETPEYGLVGEAWAQSATSLVVGES
jgi:hypothetical protein